MFLISFGIGVVKFGVL